MKFGTDGVRGRAYDELSLADVTRLARVAAPVLDRDRVVIGHDTRLSGPDFVAALAAGFAAEGVTVLDLGVAPTPAVAHIAATDDIAGAMVSASHNPWHDNGIKLFGPGGKKLSDAVQWRLEADLAVPNGGSDVPPGVPVDASSRLDDYQAAVRASLDGRRLDGLHVVADAAFGAASAVVAPVLASLGARVDMLNDHPDGRNINADCGSTDPGGLAAAVVAAGADVGLAFDGDADRVVGVDGRGRVVDGDHIIAVCAIDLHARGRLADGTVVVTVMTNLGFRLAMAERGIKVHETPVGDRHVLAALEEHRWSLGGEQSGHVIFPERATTGDGLLTGLQLLDVVKRTGRSLEDLAASAMDQLPQVLAGVRVADDPNGRIAAVADRIAEVERELGERGRVLVRPSGTEPLIRVMAEAETHDRANWAVQTLIDALEPAD